MESRESFQNLSNARGQELMEMDGPRNSSPMPDLINSFLVGSDSVELSPRAELSQVNMSISSPEGMGMMVSPEEVMKRMWEEMGPVVEREAKRMRSKTGSESSQGSVGYIFSPILVKTGGEIRNVSSFSEASSSGRRGEARGANSSPLFTFDVTREMRNWRQGWQGRMDMTGGLFWGLSSPRLFVDDMSMPQRSAKERIVELDEDKRENIDEDIFDISKVE